MWLVPLTACSDTDPGADRSVVLLKRLLRDDAVWRHRDPAPLARRIGHQLLEEDA